MSDKEVTTATRPKQEAATPAGAALAGKAGAGATITTDRMRSDPAIENPWYDIFAPNRLPNALEHKPYQARFWVDPPRHAVYSLESTSILPPGLKLETHAETEGDGTSATWAALTGIPQRAGTYSFTVKGKLADGKTEITGQYQLTVMLDLDRYASASLVATGPGETAGIGQMFADPIGKDDAHYPLDAVEFLAYKSAQAYDNEAALAEDIAADPRISHFRFFNSADIDVRWKGTEIVRRPDAKSPLQIVLSQARVREAACYIHDTPEPIEKQVRAARAELVKTLIEADTQAYGFMFEGKVFIVFRGTTSTRDWRIDMDSGLTDDPEVERTWEEWLKFWERREQHLTKAEKFLIGPDRLAPSRHIGFAKAYGVVADQIEDWVAKLPHGAAGYDYVFSGHSLGGALAFCGGYDFAGRGRNVFAVVTFGAPAVGKLAALAAPQDGAAPKDGTTPKDGAATAEMSPTQHFVDAYNVVAEGTLAARTLRLQTGGDVVPRVLELMGFVHVGREWPIVLQPLPPTSRILRRKYLVKPVLAVGIFLLQQMGVYRVREAGLQLKDMNRLELASSAVVVTVGAPSDTAGAPSGTPGAAKPADNDHGLTLGDWWRAISQGGISLPFVFGVLAYGAAFAMQFGRYSFRAVEAHSAIERYALFLTTLAYRKIRAKHTAGFAGADAATYGRAEEYLRRHLAKTRGPELREPWWWFLSRPRWPAPRKIGSPKMEARLARRFLSERNFEYLF